MKLLLDTHIWLWSLQDPRRLGKRIQQELRNPANEFGGLSLLLRRVPTFVPVDGGEGFILMCAYTGKEVVR